MKKLFLLFPIAGVAFSPIGTPQVSAAEMLSTQTSAWQAEAMTGTTDGYDLTVEVKTPGTLNTLITEEQKYTTASMKVNGSLNSDDVKLIRDMAGVSETDDATAGQLVKIDFSDANFVEGGEPYAKYFNWTTYKDTEAVTENDVFPMHFFNAGKSYGCSVKEIILPESVNKIGDEAFMNCASLKSITIPDNVTELGAYSFYGSGVQNFTLPNSVTKVGSNSFYGCANLNNITLSENMTEIGSMTFQQTGLTKIHIPAKVTVIGSAAFKDCAALASVTGMENVTSISSYAFYKCSSLKDLTLPEKLEIIGQEAFFACNSLESIEIPASVSEITASKIDGHPFKSNFSMTAITIAEGNEYYYEDNGTIYTKDGTTTVCYPCGLKPENGTITVAEGTTAIGSYTYAYCQNIEKVVLPSSLKEMGSGAFSTSPNIKEITCNATVPPTFDGYGSNPFSSLDKSQCTLIVPEGSETAYKESDLWSEFNINTATGISDTGTAKDKRKVVGMYDAQGRKVSNDSKGLIIFKYDDGTAEKHVVR